MKDDHRINAFMARLPWIVVGVVILTVLAVIIEVLLRKAYGG